MAKYSGGVSNTIDRVTEHNRIFFGCPVHRVSNLVRDHWKSAGHVSHEVQGVWLQRAIDRVKVGSEKALGLLLSPWKNIDYLKHASQ